MGTLLLEQLLRGAGLHNQAQSQVQTRAAAMTGRGASSKLRHTQTLPSTAELISKAVAFPDALKRISSLLSGLVFLLYQYCKNHPFMTLLLLQRPINK